MSYGVLIASALSEKEKGPTLPIQDAIFLVQGFLL